MAALVFLVTAAGVCVGALAWPAVRDWTARRPAPAEDIPTAPAADPKEPEEPEEPGEESAMYSRPEEEWW